MRILVFLASLAIVQSTMGESTNLTPVRAVDQMPEALRLIRTADHVYVFPVSVITKSESTGTVAPQGDYRRVRAIDADARGKLGRLLGNDSSWCHCFDNTFGVGPEPKYVGFIFQKGKDKLVLLRFLRWHTQGTFNAQRVAGSLDEKGSDRLDEWEKRYARPERGLK